MKIIFGILLLFIYCRISEGRFGVGKALVYLSQYGYLDPNSMGGTSQVDSNTFKERLKVFQTFAGLPVTGVLDRDTEEVMKLPRCGMKDNLGYSHRSGKYKLQGSKWPTNHLTYRITKYPRHLDQQSVDQTIQEALGIWSKYVPLTFEPTNHKANIDIRFEVGSHGDGDPFDGPGGTLAHAFFPQFGGKTHFDDNEKWIIGDEIGTDLLQVATHEFGHALGLSHSQIREAIMTPYYNYHLKKVDLFSDDIQAIQEIYGKKTSIPESPDYTWYIFT